MNNAEINPRTRRTCCIKIQQLTRNLELYNWRKRGHTFKRIAILWSKGISPSRVRQICLTVERMGEDKYYARILRLVKMLPELKP